MNVLGVRLYLKKSYCCGLGPTVILTTFEYSGELFVIALAPKPSKRRPGAASSDHAAPMGHVEPRGTW